MFGGMSDFWPYRVRTRLVLVWIVSQAAAEHTSATELSTRRAAKKTLAPPKAHL